MLKKTFSSDEVGLACLERELAARQLFADLPWVPPITKSGPRWFMTPWYERETRLDELAPELDEPTRRRLAEQAVEILFEMFLAGYAHRDFHARNLFLVDGELKVTDFEVLGAYPAGERPPFPVSYDIVGQGLESPFETKNMCYVADDAYKASLRHVLGIPVEQALKPLEAKLRDGLRIASTTFRSGRGRHTCQAGRIYSSFDLPYLRVQSSDAQRNCARRLERFGLHPNSLSDQTLLDLGSNVGGMLFEAQKLNPARSVGVEHDQDKVDVATRVAAYNGLNTVSFMCGNLEKLDAAALGEASDVVFCLAVEAHIQKKDRFYRLLGEVTRGTLYFEGNETTNQEEVTRRLTQAGFSRVEYLGLSDDDCIPKNNTRPLWAAFK